MLPRIRIIDALMAPLPRDTKRAFERVGDFLLGATFGLLVAVLSVMP